MEVMRAVPLVLPEQALTKSGREARGEAWVHCHGHAHGLEVKVGVVPSGRVAVGATRRALGQRT